MTIKAMSSGGCCCGGCLVIPWDSHSRTSAIQPMQQHCCSCVPKLLCLTLRVPDDANYSTRNYTALVPYSCEGVAPAGQAPVIYQGVIDIDGEVLHFEFFFEIDDYGDCSFCWKSPDLYSTGCRLIDHDEEFEDPYCETPCAMKTEACCNFGGVWHVAEGSWDFDLIVEPAHTLDLARKIDCAGCQCVCQCARVTVFKRTPEIFSYVGGSEISCAKLTWLEAEHCDGKLTLRGYTPVQWYNGEWGVALTGKAGTILDGIQINAGTEVPPSCHVSASILLADELEHVIEADEYGIVDVEYVFDTFTSSKALNVTWVGRTYDENASVEAYAWNWETDEFESLGAPVDGRPTTTTLDRSGKWRLEPEHTGEEEPDRGFVKIKLIAENATQLVTNRLTIESPDCCKLKLVPPSNVTLTSEPEEFSLLYPNNCPNPTAAWEVSDDDGNEYMIAFECAWCGTSGGTPKPGGCCPSIPVPRVLTATVETECEAECGFTMPIDSGITGSIWENSVAKIYCGWSFSIRVSCAFNEYGEPEWGIVAEGAGGCTFNTGGGHTGPTAQLVEESCDPFYLRFEGEFKHGIGCCDGSSPIIFSIPMTITITE